MNAIVQNAIYFVIILLLTKPVGLYMYRIFGGERTFLSPAFRPVERGIYRLTGVDETKEMRWTTYTVAMLLFSLVGLLATYLILLVQNGLPFNPQDLANVEPRLAFNTAVSFTTNTNWHSYVPEVTMSYFSQMAGLATHNFMSAATGIAIAIALVRGFARHSAREIGNFWVDLTRCTLYLLLPVCVVGTIVLVALGVPQNLNDYTSATTLAGAAQTIGQGPVASQEIIKEFGTNGGGFFNANSAHPFENPTPFTNLLEMVAIFAIPAGLTYTFGKMVGHTKQGWAILAAMSVLFLIGVTVATVSKREGNPLLTTAGADQSREIAGRSAPGGNMEGKESRFGITASSLFAVITTAASCGAVNSMHDSFTPLGGLVPLANIGLGEVIFGYGDDKVWFVASITAWLWFTVLFANFAEAMAEGRGKAQADALRKTRTETKAKLMVGGDRNRIEERASAELRPGDLVLVEAGDTIPSDGEVVEGVAYVSEAAITGESAPVLKEPGTDIASSVTGGTQVISDHLVVRITAEPGKTFLDRMIALVEGAARQKTPNEIALNILLAGLTIIFLIVVVALNPFSRYAGASAST